MKSLSRVFLIIMMYKVKVLAPMATGIAFAQELIYFNCKKTGVDV